MKDKVVVITGATSGIGEIAAQRLAAMGARLVLLARNPARGEATIGRLRQIAPGGRYSIYCADLSRLAEMKRVAKEIAAAEPRIDVLINNAGAIFAQRQTTPDGLEMTFATNHMAYFVLTQELRDRLIAAAPARIVSTSSDAHRNARLDFADLQSTRSYSYFGAYSRSKLCNILFTRELARRMAGTGVTANCLHPGFVNTRFGDEGHGVAATLFRLAKKFAISPEQGAETIVYLASSPDVAQITGEYFYKCRPKTPTKEAQDDVVARKLWDESERTAGIF
jgi:NAD(P)-dependent dehydrogenase (short-subunit alcohol dehydrogenase family)